MTSVRRQLHHMIDQSLGDDPREALMVPRVPPHRRADHESEATRDIRATERLSREIANGTWQRHHDSGGDDDPVAW